MGKNSTKWESLDVLRGIAVAFMLVNHAAVNWLNPGSAAYGLSGIFNFVGSFAPVLFFFATGVGYGLAHQAGKPANTKDLLIKALILIVADIFMRGGDFTTIGWDFLAFIAFSMILLHGFRGRQYGISAALVLVLVLLFVRFGLGAAYDKLVADQADWHRIVLGLAAMEGVSYWFTPWFVYPLVGFVFGAIARQHKSFIEENISKVLAIGCVLGVLCGLMSWVLLTQGAGLFRWGTMSLNFFVASVSCVLISLTVSLFVTEKIGVPSLTALVSMQGVSSLAVVPIHYFFLDLIAFVITEKMGGGLYLLLMPLWLIVCFFCARCTNQLVVSLTRGNSPRLLYALIGLIVVSAIITTVMPAFVWIFVLTFAAQYMLCILLGFSYAKR